MSEFVSVKALAGFNYVRPAHVVAISATEASKCNIYLAGGVTVPCSEPAKDVMARLAAATQNEAGETREESK